MGRYDGFDELVAARRMALSRAALVLTGDPDTAEALVQEALTRAAQRWPRAMASGDPSGFLLSTLVEVATRPLWWRRGSAERPPPAAVPTQPGGRSADVLVRLKDLPAQLRAVLYLRYVEELDDAVTARLVGCTTGAVRSLADEGLARLDGRTPPPGAAGLAKGSP